MRGVAPRRESPIGNLPLHARNAALWIFRHTDLLNNINGRLTYSTNAHRWEMDFNLLQAATGVRIAADKELPDLTKEGQRTIQSSQGLSRLIGPWKVWFLECLQGVILRNRMHHLEAARWHTDLVLKREKQADSIGRRAAAVLCRAGADETALGIGIENGL